MTSHNLPASLTRQTKTVNQAANRPISISRSRAQARHDPCSATLPSLDGRPRMVDPRGTHACGPYGSRISGSSGSSRPLEVPPQANGVPFGPEPPQQAAKPEWLRDFEKDAEHDPQIAALLKGANGDPEVVQKRMMQYVTSDTEDVMSQDRGAPEPMDVVMRGIDPFNCWIWVELKDDPTMEDVETCSEVFKSWFILGRLGGYNSMNMQVLGSAEDGGDGISYMRYNKEELETTVDSTFHDITGTEQKGRWLRTWVNMGTADELAIDVLINAMSTFSRENVGIKQFVMGGENEDWPIPEAEMPKSSMNPMSTDMPGDEMYGGRPSRGGRDYDDDEY